MTIIDKIERKFPSLGFRNLNLYMVVIFLVGLAINVMNPLFYAYYLSLNGTKLMQGEIWRIFTFIFYPPSTGRSVLLSLLMIYVYYSITKTLIMMWGNFKFNLYLFIGYISQILAAVLVTLFTDQYIIIYPLYTTFSLIMAFSLSFPDAYFMIYFLIPIKAKFFAYLEIILYIVIFLGSDFSNRIAVLCSAVNVFVYFVLLKNRI